MNRAIRSGRVAYLWAASTIFLAIGSANGRVAASSFSRRIDPSPYRFRTAINVASSGLLFTNLSR